jgi:WD40 repeat protein
MNPYPGLRPFRRDEAHLFFGREAALALMLERLREQHFLAVTGPSGCGKSSLVRAGLLHALELGDLGRAHENWRMVVLRPGDSPLNSLAKALATEFAPELTRVGQGDSVNLDQELLIRSQIERGPAGLAEWLESVESDSNRSVLLLIDQFEEIFRYEAVSSRDPLDRRAEIDRFIQALLTIADRGAASERRTQAPGRAGAESGPEHDDAATSSAPAIFIVLTIRLDFLGECAQFDGLSEAISKGQFLVPRLSRGEVEPAISEPAKVFGGAVEERLVSQLANDIAAEHHAEGVTSQTDPDMLPLMQHVLSRLWQAGNKQSGGRPPRPSLEEYQALGGVTGALSSHLDSLFSELTPQDQLYAERMFKALCHSSTDGRARDVRRPITLRELSRDTGAPKQTLCDLIATFSGEGKSFLAVHGEPGDDSTIVEISHEALIRQWQRLQTWVREEESDQKEYASLERQALAWQDGRAELLAGRGAQAAYKWWTRRPDVLHWASRYGRAPELVGKYIKQSEGSRTGRRRAAAAVFTVVGVAILVVTYLMMSEHEYAQAQQTNAQQFEMRVASLEANTAQATLEAGNPELAAALIREFLPPAAGGLHKGVPYNAKAEAVLYAALRPLSEQHALCRQRAIDIASDGDDWAAIIGAPIKGKSGGFDLALFNGQNRLREFPLPADPKQKLAVLHWKGTTPTAAPVTWLVVAAPKALSLISTVRSSKFSLPGDITSVAAMAVERSTGILALSVQTDADTEVLFFDLKPVLGRNATASADASSSPDEDSAGSASKGILLPPLKPLLTYPLLPACKTGETCDPPASLGLMQLSGAYGFIYAWQGETHVDALTQRHDRWALKPTDQMHGPSADVTGFWSDGGSLLIGTAKGDLYDWSLQRDRLVWHDDLGNLRLDILGDPRGGELQVFNHVAPYCVIDIRLADGEQTRRRCLGTTDEVVALSAAVASKQPTLIASRHTGLWSVPPDSSESVVAFPSEASARDDSPEVEMTAILTPEEGSRDPSARLTVWDTESEKILASSPPLRAAPDVPSMVLSPSGRNAFFWFPETSGGPSQAFWLDLLTGRKIPLQLKEGSLSWVRFSDDGSRTYALSSKNHLWAWAAGSGRLLWTEKAPSNTTAAVLGNRLILADGKFIDQITGKVVDAHPTWKEILWSHELNGSSLTFLLTKDGRLRRLSSAAGAWQLLPPPQQMIEGSPLEFSRIVSDRLGRTVAGVTDSHRLMLWGPQPKSALSYDYNGADVDSGGDAVLAYNRTRVDLFAVSPAWQSKSSWQIAPREARIETAFFSPDGRSLIVMQRGLVTRRTLDGKIIESVRTEDCADQSVHIISSSDRFFLECGNSYTIVKTQPRLGIVTRVDYSSDDAMGFAAGDAYRWSSYWVNVEGKALSVADDHSCCQDPSWLWSAQTAAQAKRAVAYSELGDVLLWDATQGKGAFSWLERNRGPIESLAVNSKYVVVLHPGGHLTVYDQKKAREVQLTFPAVHLLFPYGDQESLIIRTVSNQIEVLNLQTDRLVDISDSGLVSYMTTQQSGLAGFILSDGTMEVRTLQGELRLKRRGVLSDSPRYMFDEQGEEIIHPVSDHELEVVPMSGGRVVRLSVGNNLSDYRLSPNGKYVAVVDKDDALRVWNVDTATLLAGSEDILGKYGTIAWFDDDGITVVSNSAVQNFVFPTLHFRSPGDFHFLGNNAEAVVGAIKPRQLTPEERQEYLQ